MLFPTVLASVLLLPTALAHFVLNYPPSLGFDDESEGESPCGGETVSFNGTLADIQAEGFPIAVRSTHPQAQFLYKATTSTEAPYNWTNLLPVVSEVGLGDFCLPAVTIPSSFVGSRGLIQVIQDGPDGVLYQCAAVNFVTGRNSSVGAPCSNSTGVTATITTESNFTNTPTTSSTTPSPTHNAATVNGISSALLFLGALVVPGLAVVA